MRMVAPGFRQRMPDGQLLSYHEAAALLQEWFATAESVTGYEVEIGALDVQADRAVADIVEKVATTFTGAEGRRHERLQTSTAQVTWVRETKGWRIAQSDYRSGTMTVDGKPVATPPPVA
jgi:hypothetical protein